MIPRSRYIVLSSSLIVIYLLLVLSPFEKFLSQGQVSSSPRFLEKYKNHNLFEYMGYYYGLNVEEDPAVIRQIHTTARYPWGAEDTIKDLKECIDQDCVTMDVEKPEKTRAEEVKAMFAGGHASSQVGLLFSENPPVWTAQSPPKYPEWLTLDFLQPILFMNLFVVSQPDSPNGHNEHTYAPKDFTFQASMDGVVWVDLLTVKDNFFDRGSQGRHWSIKNKTAYSHYRIYVTAGGNPNFLSIFKIGL